LQAFENNLRERGWEEGRNIVFERRFTGPDPARFPELAEELVGLKVDIILSAYTPVIAAVRSMTTTTPIIMVGVADPVGSGLVTSLARPGGNITGLANQIEIVSAKNFELLKEIKPGIKRVGIVFSPNNAPSAKTAKAMQEEIGPRLGLTVVPVGVTKPEDFGGAFELILREQVEALHVLPVPAVFTRLVEPKLSNLLCSTVCRLLVQLASMCGMGFLCPTDTIAWPRGLVPVPTLIAFSEAPTPPSFR
jgi:putative ABC transport system substrate-binding protein